MYFFQGQNKSGLNLNELFPNFHVEANPVRLEITLDSKGWGEISIWKNI